MVGASSCQESCFFRAKGPVRGSSSFMLGFIGVKVGALSRVYVCVKERALTEPEHTEMCGHLATRS